MKIPQDDSVVIISGYSELSFWLNRESPHSTNVNTGCFETTLVIDIPKTDRTIFRTGNRSRDYRVSFRICQEREKCCTG